MIPQKTKEFYKGTQKNYDLAKCLSFFSSLLLLGGCASTMSQYDLSTCLKRGGKVENRCTVMSRDSMGRNTGCQMSQDVCVGGISYEAYEKQQKIKKEQEQLSKDLKSRPPQVLSPEEKAAKRQHDWEIRLRVYASDKVLKKDSQKYPELSWLSSRWCLKDSDSKIPANFYLVSRNTRTGTLNVIYGDIEIESWYYTHVEVHDNYYDLWYIPDRGYNLRDELGRRIKKISNEEFALVYIFRGPQLPKDFGANKEKTKEFTVTEGSKVSPDQHIKNPNVFVKCE